eukprot:1662022-Pyramimonas_sp.AAC.1
MNFASQGPLEEPLEAVLERVGVLVGRLEGILGVFGTSWVRPGPSWDPSQPVVARFEAGPG